MRIQPDAVFAMRMRRVVSAIALFAVAVLGAQLLVGKRVGHVQTAQAQAGVPRHILKLQINLRERDPADFTPLLDRAKTAGYDAVLFIDGKLNNYDHFDWAEVYTSHLRALREQIRSRGMQMIVATAPIGYCDPVLATDPNLANAYPLRDVLLVAHNGKLVPTENAAITNGSFERSKNGMLDGWDQKDPGAVVDTAAVHDGAASLRLSAQGGPTMAARAFTTVAVKPFHQYRVRFWAKLSKLDANSARLFVLDPNSGRNRDLTTQYLSVPGLAGSNTGAADKAVRSYFPFARNRTLDWAEMEIAFNSLELDKVRIGFGVDTSTAGAMWIDNVRMESTPMLNLLRRNTLTTTLKNADGSTAVEGRDVAGIADPLIGKAGFDGLFDTYHDAPVPILPAGSRIPEGATVRLSGWHAMVTASGQTGCSWHDPAVVAQLDRTVRRIQADIAPDGFMLDIDEVRTGGWEPTDASFPTVGAAFAAMVQREIRSVQQIAPGRPVYMWNDMVDPQANAKPKGYYQVREPLTGSWIGLPKELVIINWTAGGSPVGPASMKHFAKLGVRQIAAGFYDHPVADNRRGWQRAAKGVANIVGTMYTTWQNDYTELEAFATTWWG